MAPAALRFMESLEVWLCSCCQRALSRFGVPGQSGESAVSPTLAAPRFQASHETIHKKVVARRLLRAYPSRRDQYVRVPAVFNKSPKGKFQGKIILKDDESINDALHKTYGFTGRFDEVDVIK